MRDEPVLGPEFDASLTVEPSERTVAERIRALVAEEAFAVLCTQGDGKPYGSVVAYAYDPDLKSFVFATPRATRKFRLLSLCDRVALTDGPDRQHHKVPSRFFGTLLGKRQKHSCCYWPDGDTNLSFFPGSTRPSGFEDEILWPASWRLFSLICSEVWNLDDGQECLVSHYFSDECSGGC